MARFTPWLLALAALILVAPVPAHAGKKDGGPRYEVTITNLTKGQTFTPILVATHEEDVSIFQPGKPAGRALEILAEAGDTGPLTRQLMDLGGRVGHLETLPGLLGPGETRRVVVRAHGKARYLTLAAMLIPTNDTFFSLPGLRLPSHGSSHAVALAYDAGTEENDQNCDNIPGPVCGGEGFSPDPGPGDEGHVYVSNGFHDLGEDRLDPFTYDWRNPVALIRIQRIH